MSHSEISLIAYLTGSENYDIWALHMHAFIGQKIVSGYRHIGTEIIDGTLLEPQPIAVRVAVAATATSPAISEITPEMVETRNEEIICWNLLHGQVRSAITSRLGDHLLRHGFDRANELWEYLHTQFGTRSAATVFADYQATLLFKMSGTVDLTKEIAELNNAYRRLESANPPVVIPDFVKAMNMLNAIPENWSITSTFLQTHRLNNITMAEVRDAIMIEWQRRQAAATIANAARFSGVNRRGNNPNWQQQKPKPQGNSKQNANAPNNGQQQQQQPANQQSGNQPGPSQNGNSDGEKKKKRGKRGGKNKNAAQAQVDGAGAPPFELAAPAISFACPAIMSDSSSSTRNLVNVAREERGAGPSLASRITPYQNAKERALKKWDRRLNAQEVVEPPPPSRSPSPLPCPPSPRISAPMEIDVDDEGRVQMVIPFDPFDDDVVSWGSLEQEDDEYYQYVSEIFDLYHNSQSEQRIACLNRINEWTQLSAAVQCLELDFMDSFDNRHLARPAPVINLGINLTKTWEIDPEDLDLPYSAYFAGSMSCSISDCSECKGIAHLRFDQVMLLDSGASSHFSPFMDDFAEIQYGSFGTVTVADGKTITSRLEKANVAASCSEPGFDTLHRRLGHPSRNVMTQLRSNALNVPEISIPKQVPVCNGCALGKLHQQPFPASGTRTESYLDLIHMDLVEFPVMSYHCYKWVLTIIDDFSSHAWTLLLRSKADTFVAFKRFLATVELQSKKKVLKIRRIIREMSAPHVHQQNGRAERFNQTIVEKAQTMRLDACIPDSWWEFAVETAVHLYNRTPVRRLNWKTPYELVFGAKPDLGHLRVFGCGAYVFIPKDLRANKLAAHSEPMIFVGYDIGSKSYKFIHHTMGNKEFSSPTAIFDEDWYPKLQGKSHRNDREKAKITPPVIKPTLGDGEVLQPNWFPDDIPYIAKFPEQRSRNPMINLPPPNVPPVPPAPGPSQPRNASPGPSRPRPMPVPPPPPSPSPQPSQGSGNETPMPAPSDRKGKKRATVEDSVDEDDSGLRRSTRLRTPRIIPDNLYNDPKPFTFRQVRNRGSSIPHVTYAPSQVETDWLRNEMMENSRNWIRENRNTRPLPKRQNPTQSAPDTEMEEAATGNNDTEMGNEEGNIARIVQEGGNELLEFLLANVVKGGDNQKRPEKFRDLAGLPADERDKWLKACLEELEALKKHNVFTLVPRSALPKGCRPIGNRWVFNVKSDGRYRSRLVAQGFSQVHGVDYDELFSPVVRYETTRLLLALAALEDYDIECVDVKTAYLYGKLDEEIYMEQPEGFQTKGMGDCVWKLNRALYSLKQAGLAWWREMSESMLQLGFKRCKSDAGIYVIHEGNDIVIAIVYVNDVLFMGTKGSTLLKRKKEEFMEKWECRDSGTVKEFLGMQITRDRKNRKIYLDQCDYLEKVLERFKMTDVIPV
ncbi:hypothetical protein NP233_g369 [Leucocoprinus birnbaumii]|uniref:Integrase catalytic domain-containing protein n=1 Tax=Leucocoprinus birnbaumii TaxID=56174 RepID=A0AAD5W4D2_9AGAR|nr:hypothetical protein NP233_g369 [Leucocoprinus birnbaumii]